MSAYMIKAVLSNPQHPEYGQVTIPFPIQAKLMFQIIYDFDPYKPPVARNGNLHKK